MRAIIRQEVLHELGKKDKEAETVKPAAVAERKTKRELQVRIGANVRRLREKAGLNQSEVARQLPKCSPSRINNLESGRIGVSVPYLRKLAHLFSVDISELFKILSLVALATSIALPILFAVDSCPECSDGLWCLHCMM